MNKNSKLEFRADFTMQYKLPILQVMRAQHKQKLYGVKSFVKRSSASSQLAGHIYCLVWRILDLKPPEAQSGPRPGPARAGLRETFVLLSSPCTEGEYLVKLRVLRSRAIILPGLGSQPHRTALTRSDVRATTLTAGRGNFMWQSENFVTRHMSVSCAGCIRLSQQVTEAKRESGKGRVKVEGFFWGWEMGWSKPR